MERIENTILRNLLYNEEFARKTLPFIKDEYFSQYTDKTIFKEIYKYFDKFTNLPSKEALIIELSDRNDLKKQSIKITHLYVKKKIKKIWHGCLKEVRNFVKIKHSITLSQIP